MVRCRIGSRALLLALLAAGSLSGCAEYLDRKNTIAFSAGDAVETNVITHVTDPWPPHARNKNIEFSGERLARAVRRYECGPTAEDAGSNNSASGKGFASPTININSSPPAETSSASGSC